jgi:hypothetical protein
MMQGQKTIKLPMEDSGNFPSEPNTFKKRVRRVISGKWSEVKWSEVKEIRNEDGIEYFHEKWLKSEKWSEVKGFWSGEKSSIYREEVRNLLSTVKWNDVKWSEVKLSEVKWREVKWFWSKEEIEYFQERGLESVMWSEVKGIWSGVKIS